MPGLLTSLPNKDSFRMPAEFEPHSKTWMLWPQRPDSWRLDGKPAQEAFVSVARAIAQFELVVVGANPEQYHNARQMLSPVIRVIEIPNNDAWMRDCGPTFVINDKGIVRGIDWIFNAWGGTYNGLYYPWDLDEAVARAVFSMEVMDYYKAPIVLEGGSIHVDGEGTCITTAECLLSPGRNPELSPGEIEQVLKDYLGVEKVIWLKRGVFNDETSGHVDNITCFIRPAVLALTWTDDQFDPQYERSNEAYETLMTSVDALGRQFTVHKIYQPDPMYITKEEADGVKVVEGNQPRIAGDRMAASYVNFYFCNGAAIVPIFGDRHDQIALDSLHSLMPERKIIGIPSREILLGGGNIHCITQQEPRGARVCIPGQTTGQVSF